jgi:hypothetical protein
VVHRARLGVESSLLSFGSFISSGSFRGMACIRPLALGVEVAMGLLVMQCVVIIHLGISEVPDLVTAALLRLSASWLGQVESNRVGGNSLRSFVDP